MNQCTFAAGNGEQGKPFPMTDADRVDQAYRENGFNIYVSDRISLNRSVPDIRHPKWVQKKNVFIPWRLSGTKGWRFKCVYTLDKLSCSRFQLDLL